MIKFDGTIIEGTHGMPVAESPKSVIWRRHHPGLLGETEIWGNLGGRKIKIKHILTSKDDKTAAALQTRLETLELRVGDNGLLEIIDGTTEIPAEPENSSPVLVEYPECTLDAVNPLTLDGRDEWTILQDMTGALFPDDPADFISNGGSYFTYVELVFYQLYPDRNNP